MNPQSHENATRKKTENRNTNIEVKFNYRFSIYTTHTLFTYTPDMSRIQHWTNTNLICTTQDFSIQGTIHREISEVVILLFT